MPRVFTGKLEQNGALSTSLLGVIEDQEANCCLI